MIRTAVALVLVGGCANDPCPACEEPQTLGNVANAGLTELSGIAAGTRIPGVIYAHNDSSDNSRLFAMSKAGEDLGVIEISDARNDDWEDIAVGPCASGSCLFIGDTGDNNLDRVSYAIYVIDEPADLGVGRVEALTANFVYESGPRDAEVLLVHPMTGAVTVVEKEKDGPAEVFELETLIPGGTVTAKAAGTLDPPKGSAKFTGGAVHPDATGVLMRTKTRLFHFPMEEGETVAEALQGEPCRLPLADEAQGEAVTWLGAGEEFMTVGEGIGAAVSVSSCEQR